MKQPGWEEKERECAARCKIFSHYEGDTETQEVIILEDTAMLMHISKPEIEGN